MAVPQSGSNIYIHEDGHWSTSGVGPGTDRELSTQLLSI
ncbi:hypothetical protein FM121_06665 [Vagococcus fluvialis bH819]|uniref:Uncharacterized protein n=1 Tax=Vagococcus fluvialis bH819 TaxID=1255619 RepID=A0A1X6WN62_9ENTE|nr:hypothetical protein FM121_06665 [Vagococcus fluvialis bH819]